MTLASCMTTLRTQTAVPATLHEGLAWYVVHGRPTGHFLRACIEGNLFQACARADIPNRAHLYDIVYFLVNYAPAGCCGSAERVDAWQARFGLAERASPKETF
jgi:hypothetical protein